MTNSEPRIPDLWWSPEHGFIRRSVLGAKPPYEFTNMERWFDQLPADAVKLGDVEALASKLNEQDALRKRLHDFQMLSSSIRKMAGGKHGENTRTVIQNLVIREQHAARQLAQISALLDNRIAEYHAGKPGFAHEAELINGLKTILNRKMPR